MAILSSHILNGVDGTHAGGIPATLTRLDDGTKLFTGETDEGGRLSGDLDLADADPAAVYELVFETAPYWKKRNFPCTESQTIEEVVLRFKMPDNNAKYHRPVILSPNAYSVWISG